MSRQPSAGPVLHLEARDPAKLTQVRTGAFDGRVRGHETLEFPGADTQVGFGRRSSILRHSVAQPRPVSLSGRRIDPYITLRFIGDVLAGSELGALSHKLQIPMPYLRVLGGSVLEEDDGEVTGVGGRRHALALLALLATAPIRTLSRGKLVGLLWPESSEKAARNRLSTCVHQVRRAIGKTAVVSTGDDLRLDPERLGCDVFDFQDALEAEDYERAIAAYGGPFLDGFYLSTGARTFEERVERERAQLRRDYLGALEAMAEKSEEKGEPAKAAEWWEKRLSHDRYDGRIVHRLMQAWVAAGNPAAALRVARFHARLLEEQLGTEVTPQVRDLVEELTELSVPDGSTGEWEDGLEPASRRETVTSPIRQVRAEGEPSHRTLERPATTGSVRRSRRPATKPLLAALVAVGLLSGVVAGTWYLVAAGGTQEPPPAELSLAVLPFDPIGGDEAALLAHGFRSGLLTRLSGVSGLTVISEMSSQRLAQDEGPLPGVAAALRVGWIVRADVQQVGDRVQVNARLVDAMTDRQIWARSYLAEINAENVFELQSEIAENIAESLAARLTPGERRRIAAVPTENTAAYELYLQAQILREMRSPTEERLARRLALYRRATELDPEFAEAWAGLAHGYVARIWVGGDPEIWGDSALDATHRSLELNADLAAGYTQLGNVLWTLGGSAQEATRAYRRALELEPSSHDAATNLVAMLSFQGDLVELTTWLDRLHRLSPDDSHVIGQLAVHNAGLGRHEVADAWFEYGRRNGHALTEKEFMVQLFHRGNVARARTLLNQLSERQDGAFIDRLRAALHLYDREWGEARRSYRAISPDVLGAPATIFTGLLADGLGLAHALDRQGDRDEARALAREVIEATRGEFETGVGSPAPRHRMAVAHLILGDTASALDWLEESVDEGYRWVGEMLTVPVLEPIHGYPRFRALVDRMDSLRAEARRHVEESGWAEPPPGSAS